MTQLLPRIKSGIPGLDAVLCGGLVEGSSYIIQGEPGAGKTILANQIAFNQALQGKRVLYVTLLAESHERLFQSLSTLKFYDSSKLGDGITYISVFQTLRMEGLHAVVSMLREEIGRQRASVLVVDGLLSARDKAESNLDVKTFIAELQGHAAFASCTALFLTSARVSESSPEHTMVDGVIELAEKPFGVRTARHLQVAKSRGSASLNGLHSYTVSDSGVTVFPRLESQYGWPAQDHVLQIERTKSGIVNFDEIIGGGLPTASVSIIMGPSGSGKTTFGLSFLKEATLDEPGLHFGFYETLGRLQAKGLAIGMDVNAMARTGAIDVVWQPLTENLLDALGHRLLEAIHKRKVKRLFIDGLGGFQRASVYPDRLVEFFGALLNEVRALGVTTLATWEMREMFGSSVPLPSQEFSSIVDNLFLLRQVELNQEFVRVMSILKMRDSEFDSSQRELSITPNGVIAGNKIRGAEGLVTGMAHNTAKNR